MRQVPGDLAHRDRSICGLCGLQRLQRVGALRAMLCEHGHMRERYSIGASWEGRIPVGRNLLMLDGTSESMRDILWHKGRGHGRDVGRPSGS